MCKLEHSKHIQHSFKIKATKHIQHSLISRQHNAPTAARTNPTKIHHNANTHTHTHTQHKARTMQHRCLSDLNDHGFQAGTI